MAKKLNEIIAAAVFAGVLFTPAKALAENGFVNLRPAYNITKDRPTFRVEGGTDITDKINTFNFFDVDSKRENKADFGASYAEGRFEYKLTDLARAAVQYEIGTGMKPIVRVGFTLRPKIHKSNFTLLKLFPYETSGELGPSAMVFTSQDFGQKMYAELYFHYNSKSKDYIVWPEIGIKVTDNLRTFVQGRCHVEHEKSKCDVVGGLKYGF